MNPTCHPEPVAIPASLRDFMRGSRIGLDQLQWLDGAWVPQPYRDLLVHEREMTPTLEAFHRDVLCLQVLRAMETRPGQYLREVLLLTRRMGRPVVYGVIEVYLGRFAATEAAAVRDGKEPLGGILIRSGTDVVSRPLGFFRYDGAFPFFDLPSGICYGRYNQLLDVEEEPVARIFEILAPLPDDG